MPGRGSAASEAVTAGRPRPPAKLCFRQAPRAPKTPDPARGRGIAAKPNAQKYCNNATENTLKTVLLGHPSAPAGPGENTCSMLHGERPPRAPPEAHSRFRAGPWGRGGRTAAALSVAPSACSVRPKSATRTSQWLRWKGQRAPPSPKRRPGDGRRRRWSITSFVFKSPCRTPCAWRKCNASPTWITTSRRHVSEPQPPQRGAQEGFASQIELAEPP